MSSRGSAAADVTACIATFRRPDELAATIRALLAGSVVPATVLVSEGSRDEELRREVERISAHSSSPDVQVRVLPAPPNGLRNGNRNWLVHHVEAEFALLLDDDVDLAPGFLADGLARMRRDDGLAVVTGTSRAHPEPVWLRHRGFFRPARPGEPIAVTLAAALWRTLVYRRLWADEAIEYGYEEVELALRVTAAGMVVGASPLPFLDRCAFQTVGLGSAERDAHVERARGYVAVKRYGASRRALVGFLLHELAANVGRGRRPLPAPLVRGQWRAVAAYLAGGRRPSWSDLRARPAVAHLDGEDTDNVRIGAAGGR